MRFYLLSDNVDTLTGMRLAGIEGEVLHTSEEALTALNRVLEDPNIGVVLLTRQVVQLCPEEVEHCQLTRKRPLLVEIPDRHGAGDVSETIARYVNEAIGVKL